MPRYQITNKKRCCEVEMTAPFAQKALEKLGWPVEDCVVEIIPEPMRLGAKRTNHVPGLIGDMDHTYEG